MLFTVSKDEWNTKEDTEECIATAVCQKAPLGLKQHHNQWKNQAGVALAIIELRWSEDIS